MVLIRDKLSVPAALFYSLSISSPSPQPVLIAPNNLTSIKNSVRYEQKPRLVVASESSRDGECRINERPSRRTLRERLQRLSDSLKLHVIQ